MGAGSLFGAEQGAQLGHVETGPGAVHHGVEHPVHGRPGREEQVPAVLDLVDGVVVDEPGPFLLGQIQPEAQAGGVDPPIADLAQTPYSRGLRQGVCELGQARGIGDLRETVSLLPERHASRGGHGGHVLVAVADDLRPERRVTRHLDGDVPPHGIDDMEAVVVDIGRLLGQVADRPSLRSLHVPGRRWGPGHQDHEHPRPQTRMVAKVLLGDEMLALPRSAVDDRHAMDFGPLTNPTGEPAGHAHEVSVVEILVAVVVPSPPPGPEPAGAVSHREVGVEHDPVDAVITAGQQVAIAIRELVTHPPRYARDHHGQTFDCPEGAPAPELVSGAA